jgi:NADH-quinone oxidoreductase subunit J
MTATLLAQAAGASREGNTAEAVLFWVLAPVALGSAVLTVLSRKAVHAALWLVVVFFCLAVFYAAQDAPFLAAVQVIVYTGAIMVLFLFVLMLVGVDNNESLVETIRGQRIAAVVAGLGFIGLLLGSVGGTLLDLPDRGLEDINEAGNVRAIGEQLFKEHVFAFEATSALLIVAAMGTMVLAHKERVRRRSTQRELSVARFAAGGHPTPLSGPPVYAESMPSAQVAPPAPGSAADPSLGTGAP